MFEQIIASDAASGKFWYPIYSRHIFTNANVIYHHTEMYSYVIWANLCVKCEKSLHPQAEAEVPTAAVKAFITKKTNKQKVSLTSEYKQESKDPKEKTEELGLKYWPSLDLTQYKNTKKNKKQETK